MITGLYCHPRRKTTAEAARPRTGYRAAAGDVNAPVTAGVNLWLVTLTQPLFSFRSFTFSARDLIMLFGGFFLLFKATMELNERLEGKTAITPRNAKVRSSGVVTQIVVLDAIFSLDSVITAVGMVDHLLVMIRRRYRYQPDVDGKQAVNAIC